MWKTHLRFSLRRRKKKVADAEESETLKVKVQEEELKYEECEESVKVIIPAPEVIEEHHIFEEYVARTSYFAQQTDDLSIIEGERVYVIKRTQVNRWFVKKHLTQETGHLPSEILQDVDSYTWYLREKIDEKIKKLPVFEKPKPGEKMAPPKFVRKLQHVNVPDGQTAQFECQVTGNPRPSITWFKQTAIIKPSEEFQIFYDEDNTTTLIIREVFPEDAGTFTVVAKNTAGFASCSSELVVEAPLSDHGSDMSPPLTRRSLSRESSLADILEGILPVFAQRPKNKTADEGTTVEMECKVAGVPEPTVTWVHDGKPLEESANISITSIWDIQMNIVVVTIKEVRCDDAGIYDIIAENTDGKAVTSLTLTVKEKVPEKPKEEPPVFTQTFSDVTVIEKETIILTAKVTGYPQPEVTWHRNGKKLKPTKTIQQIHEKDVYTLQVADSNPEKDTGEYKCVAKNTLGSAVHVAKVTVQKSGVEFLERMQDVEAKERESAIFVACVSQEDAEVKWHKDGEQIKIDEKYEFGKEGKFRKLIIRNAHLSDEGEYTCSLGEKECTADLVVVELPPEITTDMTDQSVLKGENATFHIELTKGDALVKWYKDGKEIQFSERIQLKIDGKKQKLLIYHTTFEDVGSYTCVVGQKSSAANLKVESPMVDFTAALPEKITIQEDMDATFTVELSHPDAVVQWLRDGRPISDSEDRFIFVLKEHVRQLVVRSVSREDVAEYTCVVGEQKTSTQLQVQDAEVEFTLKLRDVIVRESDVATLLVEVTRETFEVVWKKDGEELTPTQRIIIEREGRQRKLIIKEAEIEDKGFYSCSLLDKECSSQLFVEVPPQVTTETREFIAQRGDTVFMEIPFKAIPPPKVEWLFQGKLISPSKRFIVDTMASETIMKIRKVDHPDAGTYTLKLSNKYGVCTTDFKIIIIEKPDPPSTPEASEINTSALTLSWKPPPSDGGSPITNYVIEYHDRDSLRWSTYNEDFLITICNHRVENLKEGSEYMFRVTAVNEVGKSDPSQGTKFIPLKEQKGEPPAVIEHLQDANTGLKTTATLQCKITGKPTPTIKWLKNNKELLSLRNITTTFENHIATFTIGETSEKSAGNYICKASNKFGTAESTCVLKIEDPPRAEFDEHMKNVRLKSGLEYVLDAKFFGYPQPTVHWLKNGKPMESSKHALIQTKDTTTSITIRNVEGADSATYTLQLTNEAKTQTYDFKLRVLDKPEPPEPPITFPKRDKESVTLAWQPPANDGGSDVTSYTIEKCDVKRKIWIEVTKVPADMTTYTVTNLTEGNDYMFRVSATNEYGQSEPLQSGSITASSIFEKPTPPQGPLETSNMTDTSFTLTWRPAEFNGGCPILEYTVEKREVGRKVWQPVGSTDGKCFSMEVTNLKKQTPYHFRITCRNEVGSSLPLVPEEPIIPGAAISPPSAPVGPLEVISLTNKTVTLTWRPPVSSGGAEVLSYVVEKQEAEQWIRVESLESSVTTYTVQNLNAKYDYLFRISAENIAGTSPPLETEKLIHLAAPGDRPSPPTSPLEMRSTGPSSIMIEWGQPESDGGAPLLGYTIALKDTRRIMWMEVGQVDSETQRLLIKDLQEGHDYLIRIMARNEVGLSDPLESEEPIRVIRPPGFLETALPPEYEEHTASLSFSTETSSSWIREANVEPLLRSYTKHVLVGRNEYFFRIWHYAESLFK